MKKTVLGLLEYVTLIDNAGKQKKLIAKIDTGAQTCSLDINLANQLQLGPITKTRNIKSSNGTSLRPVIKMTIELAGRNITEEFNLSNRAHLAYQVLIGRNVLKQHFLIDPSLETARKSMESRKK